MLVQKLDTSSLESNIEVPPVLSLVNVDLLRAESDREVVRLPGTPMRRTVARKAVMLKAEDRLSLAVPPVSSEHPPGTEALLVGTFLWSFAMSFTIAQQFADCSVETIQLVFAKWFQLALLDGVAVQLRSGSVKVRATASSPQGTPNQRFLSIMRGRLSADEETFKEEVVRFVLGIPGMNEVVGSELVVKDFVVPLVHASEGDVLGCTASSEELRVQVESPDGTKAASGAETPSDGVRSLSAGFRRRRVGRPMWKQDSPEQHDEVSDAPLACAASPGEHEAPSEGHCSTGASDRRRRAELLFTERPPEHLDIRDQTEWRGTRRLAQEAPRRPPEESKHRRRQGPHSLASGRVDGQQTCFELLP